jgi:hypothetical protein
MQTPNPLATSYLAIGRGDQPLKSFGLGLEEYRIDGIGNAWGHNGEIDGFHNTSAYFVDAGFGLTVLDNLIPAGPLQSSVGLRELAPVIHASRTSPNIRHESETGSVAAPKQRRLAERNSAHSEYVHSGQ